MQLQGKNGHNEDVLALLANDTDTLRKWASPLTIEERAARDAAIFDHWLAGETQTEIARNLHLKRQSIAPIIKKAVKDKLGNHLHTEQAPIYNVWNYAGCDPRFGQKHPGQIPGQAILNLLLWLTEPFDFVVDPMAGGGPTIKVKP